MSTNDSMKSEYAKELQDWIESARPIHPRKWRKIGGEVFARKSLLMAAASALSEERWGLKHPWKLAATDVFVEKAQRKLTFRAWLFFCAGALTALCALAMAAYAAYMAYNMELRHLFGGLEPNGYTTTLAALRASALTGIVAFMLVFVIGLSKAMFHEGTSVLHRRHSLRFGRLYVYLKDGDVTFQELEQAFDWNRDFSTAFRDMKLSQLASPFDRMAETITEAIKSLRNGKAKSGE